MAISRIFRTATTDISLPVLSGNGSDQLRSPSPRERLQQAVEEIRRETGSQERLALLLADLDRFKLVNDLCGPAAGDTVLDILLYRCGAAMEGTRTLHLSGGEFVCLIRQPPDANIAVPLAQKMQQTIEQPIPIGQHIVHLTASIGIVVDDQGSQSADALWHAASVALSQAKGAGGNRICQFQPKMLADLSHRAELEDDVRLALMRGEIVPYYQPIVSLDTGFAKGFEALARWHHPRQGLLGPDRFLPVVDELGMNGELLFTMMRQICRDARVWPPHFTVSVNMCPAQLCNPDSAARMLQILFACGLAPGRVIVEITENALIQNLTSARETIRSLRNTGIKVALDDFGTGYASLSRLCNLQIDHLKIDRTLIHSLDREAGRKLVKAVVDLGRSLSMPVTAEGIETAEQACFLRGLDCAYGQGFYFGHPAPASVVHPVAPN